MDFSDIRFFGMKSSGKEIFDILKAWVVISLAFAIVIKNSSFHETTWQLAALASASTVGLSFVIHEFSHKWFAQRYGYWAEFRSFDYMLVLAVLSAFIGFVFASPGAVVMQGEISRQKKGIIALAGPASNMLIAILLLPLLPFGGSLLFVVQTGLLVNSWFAVLNLLPVPSFDGAKVLAWSKPVYFTAIGVSTAILLFSFARFSF
jgi:Zn-dependent protease